MKKAMRWLPCMILLAAAPFLAAQEQPRGLGRKEGNQPAGETQYRRIHGVFIGIDQYGVSRIPANRFAVRDAVEVEEALARSYGLDTAWSVKLLGPQATREAINGVISSLADDSRVGPADAVILFLSGHGVAVERNGVTGAWYIPYGADLSLDEKNPAVLNAKAVSFDSIWSILKLSQARHIFVVGDTCMSGNLLSPRGAPEPSGGLLLAANFGRIGRQAVAATGRNRLAYENPELRHGVFTYHFLRILGERAAAGKPFLADEIFSPLRSSATTKDQEPVFGHVPSSDGGNFVFFPSKARASAPLPPLPAEAAPREAATPPRPMVDPGPVPPSQALAAFEEGKRLAATSYFAAKAQLEKAAAGGVAEAMQLLAELWYEGKLGGTKKGSLGWGFASDSPHLVNAVAWAERAAAAGHAKAMRFLARCYRLGEGVKISEEMSASWLRSAAAGKDPEAMVELASALDAGLGTVKDPAQGTYWLQQAFQLGYTTAAYTLGSRAAAGVGGPKSYSAAKAWYEKVVINPELRWEHGGHSWENIAHLYREGGPGLPKNWAESKKWLEKIWALKGVGPYLKGASAYWIGWLYEYGGPGLPANEVEAIRWYQKARAEESLDAILRMASYYRRGAKGLPMDQAKARQLFEASSRSGFSLADLRLGEMLEKGEGGPIDIPAAIRSYKKAAERGRTEAQAALKRLGAG